MKRSGILFCLVGPAGSGKSSLARRLLTDYPDDLQLSVSVTSRAPRSGEREGEHYYFVSREEFERQREKGAFFEWEETHGNYYGTLARFVDEALQGTRDLLLDVDIRGAFTFRNRFPLNTVVTFLLPPSFETLEERIRNRATTSEEELVKRFQSAQREYRQFLDSFEQSAQPVNYIIVNENFEAAYLQVASVLRAERLRGSRFDRAELQQLCFIPDSALSPTAKT